MNYFLSSFEYLFVVTVDLVGGSSQYDGTIEIRSAQGVADICADHITDAIVNVVCKTKFGQHYNGHLQTPTQNHLG